MGPFIPYLKITKITKHTVDAMLQQFKDLEYFYVEVHKKVSLQ